MGIYIYRFHVSRIFFDQVSLDSQKKTKQEQKTKHVNFATIMRFEIINKTQDNKLKT